MDPFVWQTAFTSKNEDTATVLHFVWHIQYELCDWTPWIVTPNYTLYPNIVPADVPIEMNSEYNVTLDVVCNREGPALVMMINVSLAIVLNHDIVSEYAPWVMCLITRIDQDNMSYIHRSKRVYLQSYLYHNVTTTSTTQDSTSTQEYFTSTRSFITAVRNTSFTSNANNIVMSNQVACTRLRILFSFFALLCFLLFM